MNASAPLAAAAAAFTLTLCAAAQAAFPGDNGALAYTFWDSSQTTVSAFDLRVRHPGAKQPTTIYRCVYGFDVQDDPPCHELRNPSWSPDGELIAATELGPAESGGERLVILRAGGSELRRLPPLTSVAERGGGRRQTEHDPAWSPDGSRLVFTGLTGFDDLDGKRSNLDIYMVNADGTGLRRLTRARATDGSPAWSAGPGGGRIAFTRNQAGREDVYTMRPDGTDIERVTFRGGFDPSWSPDGSKLAFARRGQLYVVAADGRGPRMLTHRPGNNQPAWYPTGSGSLSSARSRIRRSSGSTRWALTDAGSDW